MAGNKDGTIPAWEGGITSPPEGYKVGMHHPDPFADDPVSFTITKQNMDQYADKLTPGYRVIFFLILHVNVSFLADAGFRIYIFKSNNTPIPAKIII